MIGKEQVLSAASYVTEQNSKILLETWRDIEIQTKHNFFFGTFKTKSM